jgi:hypothetical protein
MAAPRPRSRDFGAALAGLVLGGSVMFLIILSIVLLTNSHFAAEKAEKAAHAAAPVTQVAAPAAPAPTSVAPPPAKR